MTSNEKLEREFEDFLNEENSRVAALYRKLPRPEPDAKLDAAVQAMARRAQALAPRTRARTPRWIPALSAAAIVTLVAGIAFRLGPTVWQERETGQLQKKPAADATSMPAATSNAAAENRRSEETDAFKDQVAPKPAIPAPPAAPSASNAAAPVRAPAHNSPPARADAPAPQAFPLQTQGQEKTLAAPAGLASGVLDEQDRDRKSRQSAPEKPALKIREERRAPVPAAEPVTSAAPPPPEAREVPVPAPVDERPAPTAQAPAASGATAESTLAAPVAKSAGKAPATSRDPNARLYPEHWLANIRTMLREDKRDEALRSLGEFRKIYPDYHLPDDLRDLK
jgi:hypothetical protein